MLSLAAETRSPFDIERHPRHEDTVTEPLPALLRIDRIGVDRVYADFWPAYKLTFETDERIIAAQNEFTRVTFSGGQAVAWRHPFIRWPPYEREVEAARHGFALFRESLVRGADRQSSPEAGARAGELARYDRRLRKYGYRRVAVGPLVVYAPPT